MNALKSLEVFADMLDGAGVQFERRANALVGKEPPYELLLDVFERFAMIPADEPVVTAGGETLTVGDDSDCDLLLHESGLRSENDSRYSVWLTRQFSFDNVEGDYGGMNGLTVMFVADGQPMGRIPHAQRWGYAGRRRRDVSDDSHPEMNNWAGYATSWVSAIRASNSWKVFKDLPPAEFVVEQSDY